MDQGNKTKNISILLWQSSKRLELSVTREFKNFGKKKRLESQGEKKAEIFELIKESLEKINLNQSCLHEKKLHRIYSVKSYEFLFCKYKSLKKIIVW